MSHVASYLKLRLIATVWSLPKNLIIWICPSYLRNSRTSLIQGIPLCVGFIDSDLSQDTLQTLSPQRSSLLSIQLETAPTLDSFGSPSSTCPYDSSSPTSFGDLTKGELQFINDVETLALSASRTHPELATIPPSNPPTLSDTSLHPVDASPPPYTLDNFPSLPRTSPPLCFGSPSSPLTTPSFDDLSLLKALDIFTNKSPILPSVLSLDSIRFDNVTQWNSRKGNKTSS